MANSFFTLDEDFSKIIIDALPNKIIVEIRPISTGWTNIVFEVSTTDGNFFFRFPRDDFWSRTIVKDYEFSKFIYGKTDFNTVQLSLLYNNGRPFSMHKKIEGTVLADKMNILTDEEVKNISFDVARFMYQLHNVSFDKNGIFNVDNIGLNLSDFLDELLNLHVSIDDKKFWKIDDRAKPDSTCLVHGDLNSSNVLLDKNNHVTAFIDFGFAGFGSKYSDIARIIGRCPDTFALPIKESYESLSNTLLNETKLKDEVVIWSNIDNAYINYMKEIGIYK